MNNAEDLAGVLLRCPAGDDAAHRVRDQNDFPLRHEVAGAVVPVQHLVDLFEQAI